MIDWLDDLDAVQDQTRRTDPGARRRETHICAGEDHAPAGAAMVNRTRRVVRERAHTMQVRKSRVRSLYLPLAVSASLLVAVIFALWSVLGGYDAVPNGLPDASQQIMILLMWCLPISAALLAVVWIRRSGTRMENHIGDERPR